MNRKPELNGSFWIVVTLAVVYTTAYRLVPAWVIPNLVPVGALAFFCGLVGRNPFLALVPLGVMAFTDALLYAALSYPPYLLVYFCVIIYTLLGWLASRGSFAAQAVNLGLGSLAFFLISNFATWWQYRLPVEEMAGLGMVQKGSDLFLFEIRYADSFYGLMTCYGMGLPFFGKTLIADFVFTGLFLAAYGAFETSGAFGRKKPELAPVTVR